MGAGKARWGNLESLTSMNPTRRRSLVRDGIDDRAVCRSTDYGPSDDIAYSILTSDAIVRGYLDPRQFRAQRESQIDAVVASTLAVQG